MAKSEIPTDAVGVSGAAKILGLSIPRVKQLATAGKIGVQVAGRWLFTRPELAAFKRLDRPAHRPKKSRASPKTGNGSRK